MVCPDLCCCTRFDAISISSQPTGAKRWPTDAVPEVTFGTGVVSGREVLPQSAEYRMARMLIEHKAHTTGVTQSSYVVYEWTCTVVTKTNAHFARTHTHVHVRGTHV